MKSLALIGIATIISGCSMFDMPDITRETKDAVLDTKNGQTLAAALHLLHDDGTDDMAIRAAAAETMFMTAPEDRIHKYLGCALPLNISANPETGKANVTMVYLKRDNVSEADVPVNPGVSAPKSPRVYSFIEHAALQVLKDLAMAASKDLPADKFNDYKAKASKMIPIATAILGARAFSNSENYYRDVEPKNVKNARGETEVIKSIVLRTKAAKLLRAVAVKYSLPESDINTLSVLMDTRLGIDYKTLE